MTLSEAFDKIEQWSQEGERIDVCVVRYGKLTIDRGGIQRGLEGCMICGHYHGMGCITVQHDDGRGIGIDLKLYHYAKAGHTITEEDIDAELLAAIIADA